MSQALHPVTQSSHMACFARGWAVVACLLLIPSAVSTQAQQSGSLADIARQVRAQKGQPNADSSQAQQVAAELSEDQNDGGAPGGFKTYNAGDYKLWVPAPYRVEGHDDAGIVLSGPMVGVKHPVLLVGTPIAVHWKNNDDAFRDAATQFARLYAQSASCTKTTIADHAAYQCGLAAANLLETRVAGNAVFVLGSGNMYPVFCVAPSESQSRDILNDPNANSGTKEWSRKTLDREEADSRKVWQQCDTVFQSIRLKPEIAQQPSAQPAGLASAPQASAQPGSAQPGSAKSAQTSPAGAAAPATAGGTGSLANAPVQAHQGPTQAEATPSSSGSAPPASSAPTGYKVHPFHYCSSPTQCWDASVLVPADAQLVSSDCKQYVFETKVQGTTFLLMAGPAGNDCDGRGAANLVRWKQLADPENKRAPGTYNTVSTQVTKVDGRPATITTMHFRNGLDEWMGKRVEVDSNGVPLVVGCMALRDHFDDGDAVCSTLIGSLQLP
jgi:hypothetical protein